MGRDQDVKAGIVKSNLIGAKLAASPPQRPCLRSGTKAECGAARTRMSSTNMSAPDLEPSRSVTGDISRL